MLLNRVDQRAGLAWQLRHQLDDLLGDVAETHGERFALDILGSRLFETRYPGADVGLRGHHLLEPDAHQALKNEAVVARAVLERLEDARRHAD